MSYKKIITTILYKQTLLNLLFAIILICLTLSTAFPLNKNDKAIDFSLHRMNTNAFMKNEKSFVKEMVALKDFCGIESKNTKSLILLSFFATWCIPCINELPEIIKLYDTYKDKGLMVLSVAINIKDEAKLAEIVRKNKIGYPVLKDSFDVVAKKYDVSKLPHLFLIDKNCSIMHVMNGYDENDLSKLQGIIKEHFTH